MLGQYQPPSAPIPNLPVSVAGKPQPARPLSGGMKDVSFPIAVGPIYHRNGEREVTAT
jgi:hypothetical protein